MKLNPSGYLLLLCFAVQMRAATPPNAQNVILSTEGPFKGLWITNGIPQGYILSGDILYRIAELSALGSFTGGDPCVSYGDIPYPTQRWPKVVPYQFENTFGGEGWTESQMYNMRRAMAQITSEGANVVFLPRYGQTNYVSFNKSTTGNSYSAGLGFGNGANVIAYEEESLGSSDSNLATQLHELIHRLGFPHEQSRSDRDDYVAIQWCNITNVNNSRYQFGRFTTPLVNSELTPYDFHSTMHYPGKAFSGNGEITILVKPPHENLQDELGDAATWTETDKNDVKNVYGFYLNYICDYMAEPVAVSSGGHINKPWDQYGLDEAVEAIMLRTYENTIAPSTIWIRGGGVYPVNSERSRLGSAGVRLAVVPGSGWARISK